MNNLLGREWHAVPIVMGALFITLGLGYWVDNVHIGTMNGLWKSTLVELWKASPATARLDPSNYLYFPLEGFLCRTFDLVGIYPGLTWKQMAIVSNIFGALSTGVVFWFVHGFTRHFGAALAAAILHLGAGFVLQLSMSNEDIMPAYFTLLLSMALAARWFGAPTIRQVFVVGIVFTTAWLIEWRLMFPTLPALIVALALSEGTFTRRGVRILALLLAIVGTVLLVATIWAGHTGAKGLPDLLWTGKGIDSGWGGFSAEKLTLFVVGMGEYLVGGSQLTAPESIASGRAEWMAGLLAEIVIGVSVAVLAWRNRQDPRCRAVATVFLGTFVAGEVFNTYSQPQDPQMQLNVMAWLAVSWGICLAALLRKSGRLTWTIAIVASVLPFAYNAHAFMLRRGADTDDRNVLVALERELDLNRTVFVFLGWENTVAWAYVTWTQRWEGVCDLPGAPAAVPKFKWLNIVSVPVNHPDWGARRHVEWLKKELDCAFDKGYAVVASSVWKQSADQLGGALMSLNARDHGAALHALFNDPAYSVNPLPNLAGYFLIRRR